MSDERLIELMRRHPKVPMVYPRITLREARRTKLPLPIACAMLEKESKGGKNIFGHDVNSDGSKRPFWGAGKVTREKYMKYKRQRGTTPARFQGVGPTQLTWFSLQDEADSLGGCWRPDANMRVGFRHLAAAVRAHGVVRGGAIYNGGAGNPNFVYGRDLAARARKWQAYLKRAGGGTPARRYLARGDEGDAVVVLTRRLSYVRSPDGERYLDGRRRRFDAKTQRAVKRFQRDHGLDPDGRYGRETAKALKRAVARRKKGLEDKSPVKPDVEPVVNGKPTGGRSSRSMLEELDRLDSREDRVLEVLLRRAERLEARLGEGREVTVADLHSLERELADVEGAVGALESKIARATGTAPLAGGTATASAVTTGSSTSPDAATGQPQGPAGGDGAPADLGGGSLAGGSPTSGAVPSTGGAGEPTSDIAQQPTATEPAPQPKPQADQLTGGTASPPAGAVPAVTQPDEDQSFGELAARVRQLDAESDRLRSAISERLLELEQRVTTLDGEEHPSDEEPEKKRRVVFRVKSPPMRGKAIRALQRALNRRYRELKVKHRIDPDGIYGRGTHKAAREIAYALGLPAKRVARGLGPELRAKIVDPDRRSESERERARRRAPWVKQLRKSYAAPRPRLGSAGGKPGSLTSFHGKRVSRAWGRVLAAAEADGITFRLNSGRRTMGEQTALFRQNMVRPNVPRPGRPMTAVPLPTAPHIRVGRPNHAIDVDTNVGRGEAGLQRWLQLRGVRVGNPVAREPWHMDAERRSLVRLARRLRRGR